IQFRGTSDWGNAHHVSVCAWRLGICCSASVRAEEQLSVVLSASIRPCTGTVGKTHVEDAQHEWFSHVSGRAILRLADEYRCNDLPRFSKLVNARLPAY